MDYDLTFRPDAGRFEEALVNIPGIWGLDAAVRMQLAIGTREIEAHVLALVAYAADRLRAKGCIVDSPDAPGERSSILTFLVPGQDTDALITRLRAQSIDVAPRAGKLRLSASYYNDQSDIDALVNAL